MTDHGPWTVDAPRHLRLASHDALGLVLGRVVRVVLDVLGLVEHVLGEDAPVQPGGRDRAGLVEVLGVDGLGQLQRVPGAFDVGLELAVGVGGQVVDRGEVEEVLDLAVEPLDLPVVDAEAGLAEITDDRDDAVLVTEAGLEGIELVEGRGPRQAVDRPLAVVEELGEQETADEARRTGDEIGHWFLLRMGCTGQSRAVTADKPTGPTRVTRGPPIRGWRAARSRPAPGRRCRASRRRGCGRGRRGGTKAATRRSRPAARPGPGGPSPATP